MTCEYDMNYSRAFKDLTTKFQDSNIIQVIYICIIYNIAFYLMHSMEANLISIHSQIN